MGDRWLQCAIEDWKWHIQWGVQGKIEKDRFYLFFKSSKQIENKKIKSWIEYSKIDKD